MGDSLSYQEYPPIVALRTGLPCLDAIAGCYNPTGDLIWLSIRAFPLFQANPAVPSGVVVHFLDLTTIKQVELATSHPPSPIAVSDKALSSVLQSQVAALESLFDLAPVGVAIASDPECRFIRVNPFLQDLLGLGSEANASKTGPDGDRVPYRVYQGEQEVSGDQLPMQVAVFEQKAIHNADLHIVRADGVELDLLGSATPLFDEGGRVSGCLGFFMDVTHQKQLEADRAQLLLNEQASRNQAEAANQSKDEFLAVVAHELRSPLNAILGWAKLLRSRRYNETTTSRALEVIERNCVMQVQLIEDLLDISRITHGRIRLDLHPLDLAHVVKLGSRIFA